MNRRTGFLHKFGIIGLALFLGLSVPALAQLSFTDVAPELGIDHVSPGGGYTFAFDYDLDGDLDYLSVARFYNPSLMYRNDGSQFTELANIGLPLEADAWKVIPMDYDHDGDADVLIASYHTPWMLMENSAGVFIDRTGLLGLPVVTGCRDIAWIDIDHDGWMDILTGFVGEGWRLYRNTGGAFQDITEDSQLPSVEDFHRMADADIDLDGDVDLFMTETTGSNYLYVNRGEGVFQDITVAAGFGDSHARSGCSWADFDKDKYPDLLTQGEDYHTIWHNNGDLTFTEMTVHGMEDDFSLWVHGAYYSIADFDLDGDLDIYAGRPSGTWPGLWPNRFYRMDDLSGLDIWFTDIAAEMGMDDEEDTFPSVIDYDSDGDLDIFLHRYNAPLRLMRNDVNITDRLQVRVLGPTGERNTWHTRVEAYRHGTEELAVCAETNFSGACRNGLDHHLALDENEAYDLCVFFPNGNVMCPQDYPGLSGVVPADVGHMLTVYRGGAVEGAGEIIPVPAKFALLQNYPNPFNPSTEIRFELAASMHARLSVYNSLGQLVDDLANEVMTPGRHMVQFDATGYSSGIYFYKLEAGGLSEVRKMLLLK